MQEKEFRGGEMESLPWKTDMKLFITLFILVNYYKIYKHKEKKE